MATHSSILAWRIPWTEEPGGLESLGLHRVRHDRDLAAAAASDEKSVVCKDSGSAYEAKKILDSLLSIFPSFAF